jgi:hypothetical protein
VFKVQIISNVMVYPQTKLWATKTENKPDLLHNRLRNEIVSEPLPTLTEKKTKTERENSCSQPPNSSGINILRDYVTIYNQRHPKFSKRKNRDQFCPTFIMPGKYSQASVRQLLHPSAEELNYTGRDIG